MSSLGGCYNVITSYPDLPYPLLWSDPEPKASRPPGGSPLTHTRPSQGLWKPLLLSINPQGSLSTVFLSDQGLLHDLGYLRVSPVPHPAGIPSLPGACKSLFLARPHSKLPPTYLPSCLPLQIIPEALTPHSCEISHLHSKTCSSPGHHLSRLLLPGWLLPSRRVTPSFPPLPATHIQ